MVYMEESSSTSPNPDDGSNHNHSSNNNNHNHQDSEEMILVDTTTTTTTIITNHLDEDTTTTTTNHPEDDDDDDDVYAGYTPLDDIRMTTTTSTQQQQQSNDTTTTLVFSYEPISSTSDEITSTSFSNNNNNSGGGGIFYSNMSAFGQQPQPSPQEEEDRISSTNNTSFPVDFEALANQALRSLDEEYAATVRAGNNHHHSIQMIEPPTTVDNNNMDKEEEETAHTTIPEPETKTSTMVEIKDNVESKDVVECATKEKEENVVASLSLKEGNDMSVVIDTDAVRKAVEAIRIKSPDFLTHKLPPAQQPHSIIPKLPWNAFRRNSPKAIAATANLTRAATLAEAIQRLSTNTLLPTTTTTDIFVVHVVGADHVECQTIQSIQTMFGPFVRWMGATTTTTTKMQHIRIELLGPNIPTHAVQRNPVNLLPTNSTTTTTQLKSATVIAKNCLYHDYLLDIANSHNTNTNNDDDRGLLLQFPNLMIMYNAGIWGYNEWKPTLEAMNTILPYEIPAIITAYTIEEAEDDAEVIHNVFLLEEKNNNNKTTITLSEKRLWEAQINPFRSHQPRDTISAAKGRIYYENGAWQAWLFGQPPQKSNTSPSSPSK